MSHTCTLLTAEPSPANLTVHNTREYESLIAADQVGSCLTSRTQTYCPKPVQSSIPTRYSPDSSHAGADLSGTPYIISSVLSAIQTYNDWAAYHEASMAQILFAAGLTWLGVVLYADRGALDILCPRPAVDPNRINCRKLLGMNCAPFT